MNFRSQRSRPRQERARRIFEAGCGLVRISGRPWQGMLSLHTYGAGFHVSKGIPGAALVAVDIWPVRDDEVGPGGRQLWGHKIFGCDLDLDGRLHLRSFRRGAWEDRFLSYADAIVKGDRAEWGAEVVSIPTGGGKTRSLSELHDR